MPDYAWAIAAIGALSTAWAWLRRRRARARLTFDGDSGHFHLSLRARGFSEPPTGKQKRPPAADDTE